MKNKLNIVLLLIALPMVSQAASRWAGFWNWVLNNFILLLGVIFILAALGALFNLFMRILSSEGKTDSGAGVSEASSESVVSRWWDNLIGLKPIEKEADLDLDHDYDGIHELDNNLPPWWLYLFYFTIAFAIGYLYIFQFSDIGPSQKEEYEMAMEEGEKAKLAYIANVGSTVDETNVTLLTDEGDLAAGKEIFVGNCAACHGQLGEGGIGPNFTDKYWLHGGDVKDLFKVVKYGVPEKGMISWQSQLRPVDMQKVTSYILSLQGTNPPNQKEKQGELYEPAEG